ncbi:Rhodanese-like protein [[Leptolyngbya] sp. PCC 7376]|uniref:rhodanese-like domain-containing protein n=1 Tax=[Leptolyngbya] sp. PCC 7376 TaxID=111781 RepID=UPI00029EC8A3|nr:rhodanese-like domain-containing protein [[Leptolyngbya] sp. PCC 7376]AFY39079.1 Rhodanese-like protein [[Leptolyngbya] sp. PCC 7376]
MINKRKLLIVGLTIFLSIASSCGIAGAVYLKTGLSVPYYLRSLKTERLTVPELKQLPQDDLLIIDVRTPDEYAAEYIPNSILIPIQDIEAGFGLKKIETEIIKFQANKNQSPKIILYCQTGPRSIRAFETLQTEFDIEILVLTGGMRAWNAGI